MLDIGGRGWAVTATVAETLRRAHEERDLRALEAAREQFAARGPARSRRDQAVAVIPVMGLITHRDSWMGSSTSFLAAELRAAVADQAVDSILLEVDSPGGEVNGIEEAAALIREARASKPVVAVANTQAASAAYWLASQATELLVTPSGEVGSIGVYGMHLDLSGALAAQGIKVTLVSAGKFKTEGNPFEPLADEARVAFQSSVDRYYASFVRDVAKGRRVSVDAVRSGFGEGRSVGAAQAVASGMADGVATFEDAARRAARLAVERRRTVDEVARAQAALLRLDLR